MVSSRCIKDRSQQSASGCAVAIPLVAAVVCQGAVGKRHKGRSADALVAQGACALKGYHNTPAARKTPNQGERKKTVCRTPKKPTPTTGKPQNILDVVVAPSTPTSVPNNDAFELLSSQFNIITKEVIQLRESDLKLATANAKLTGKMEQMKKRIKKKDDNIKWLRNQIAK